MPTQTPKSPPPTNRPVRVAVVGTGSLGKEHARIYADIARLGSVEFVGVFDVDPKACRQVAESHRVPVLRDLAHVAQVAEAVNVVTPTPTHFPIARELIERGRHVLVEKPMTDQADQAARLVELAQARRCVLQVGHVERFNPVFRYLEEVASDPRFIEVHRLSSYPGRSTEIGVVLDLMIHDLDVVLAFVRSPVVAVEAVGIPVLSRSEDIANARLRFANGCVANVTASRISPERMRKIRVFSGGAVPVYVSLDYRAQTGYIYRLAREDEPESSLLKKLLHSRDSTLVSAFAGRKILREPVPLQKEEPLRLELMNFVECVRREQAPVVTGEAAKRALDLAFEITRQIRAQIEASEVSARPEWLQP